MARTGVYKVTALAYYVVMEHSTIFTRIGDVDRRSFHLALCGDGAFHHIYRDR